MPGLAEAFDRIGLALEHHLEHSHAAGAALAVTDREEILGVAVRGLADVAAGTPVRPETRFQIGSISKSFAGIVALQEVEAGRLDLHVSVNEILPWLEFPEPFGPITLHHLMTAHRGPRDRHRGRADIAGRAVAGSNAVPTTARRVNGSGTRTTAGRSWAPASNGSPAGGSRPAHGTHPGAGGHAVERPVHHRRDPHGHRRRLRTDALPIVPPSSVTRWHRPTGS